MLLNRLRHAPWSSTALRVLVLCFALGTLAYASHGHEPSNGNTHYSCDYCTSFGGLIDAPVQSPVAAHWSPATEIGAAPSRSITTRPVGIAQARAPPFILN